MANSKKFNNYTGTSKVISIPTSIDNVLVREIATNAFTSAVETVVIDTYPNDIISAPWGAQNVVWNKAPKCSITFNANGGSGSMVSRETNIGAAYKIPSCGFSSTTSFTYWTINSISGTSVSAGTQMSFSSNTTLFANWVPAPTWSENNKSSWLEAMEEGWEGMDDTVSGFNTAIVSTSTYNIPARVENNYITKISNDAFARKDFVTIGGKEVRTIGTAAFMSCSNLTTLSFPECTVLSMSAFQRCTALTSISFSNAIAVGEDTFSGCTSLSIISLPNLGNITGGAFRGCTALTTVSLPECGLVGPMAFENCTALTTVYLLSNTKAYGFSDSFSGCTNLTSIYVPANLLDSYKVDEDWSVYASKFVAY